MTVLIGRTIHCALVPWSTISADPVRAPEVSFRYREARDRHSGVCNAVGFGHCRGYCHRWGREVED